MARTSAQRSRLMARVRHTGTSAELAIRNLIEGFGIGFRTEARDLPGSPDIVNDDYRWAIFVNGCYWHAHAGCEKWTIPKTNRAFWQRKFRQNRTRDRKKACELEKVGYSVLVVWECELEHAERLKSKLLVFFKRSREFENKPTGNLVVSGIL